MYILYICVCVYACIHIFGSVSWIPSPSLRPMPGAKVPMHPLATLSCRPLGNLWYSSAIVGHPLLRCPLSLSGVHNECRCVCQEEFPTKAPTVPFSPHAVIVFFFPRAVIVSFYLFGMAFMVTPSQCSHGCWFTNAQPPPLTLVSVWR